MLELLLVMLLSIAFTFVAYVVSVVFIKKWNISHPKNRSLIFACVMLTAVMIFSIAIPLLTAPQATEDTTALSSDPDCTQSLLIIDLFYHENSPCEETICPSVSTTDMSTLSYSDQWKHIPWQTIEPFNKETEDSIPSSSLCLVGTQAIQYDMPFYLQQLEVAFEEPYPNTGGSFSREPMEESPSASTGDASVLSLFWQITLFLLLVGLGYLVLSLSLGGFFLLRSMHATPCTDSTILSLIRDIADEFHLNMPRVYTYEGSPNAFIFGFPTTLVFSKELPRILSREELKQALRHELAHIKNTDMLLKPLLKTLRIIFFYNPIVHLAYYRIIKEREFLADHYQLWSKSQKVTYMEALLKIHEHPLTRSLSTVPGLLSYSFTMPLFHRSLKQLSLTERCDHLFGEMTRKSLYTLIVCVLLLLTNISFFFLAENMLYQPTESSTRVESLEAVGGYTLEYRQCCLGYGGQSFGYTAHDVMSRIILYSYQSNGEVYQHLLIMSLPTVTGMFNSYSPPLSACHSTVPF